jgi:hypothetical protein
MVSFMLPSLSSCFDWRSSQNMAGAFLAPCKRALRKRAFTGSIETGKECRLD